MNADPMAALSAARIDRAELDAVVSQVLNHSATVTDWQVIPVPVAAITTEAVLHLCGTARADVGTVPWDLLVKIFRSPRHWPLLHMVPDAYRQTFIDGYPWRGEAELRAAGVADLMPDGLRLPVLYRSADLGDDRLVLWTEWIDAAPGGWDTARYRRAATLLARMTCRLRDLPDPAVGATGRTPLRQIVEGPIMQWVVPRAADPAIAAHPLFASTESAPLFADLVTLAGRLPAILDHLEMLDPSIGHGDACPQNLLVSRTDPDTLVAIDMSWPHPEAIGYDLGQLLIGHAHSGELAVSALPDLHAVLLDGFLDGLRREGCAATEQDVRFAFDATLVVRGAFQSLPLDRLDEPVSAELAEFAARRLELTRYLVDVGLAIRC